MTDSKKSTTKRLFIKQLYTDITMNEDKEYFLFNNSRCDCICLQGIVIKLFQNDRGINALIDDGTDLCVITNIKKFLEKNDIKKGSYVLVYGPLISLGHNKMSAHLEPENIHLITDPNLETLWILDLIHNIK